MNKTILAAVCSTLTLIGAMPLAAKSPEITIPVDDKFQVSSSNWSSGLGKTHLAWRIKTHEGKPYVCGAVVADKASSMAAHNRAILRKGYIKVQGKKVIRDLSFFTVAKPGSDLMDARAGCRSMPVKGDSKTRYQLGFDPVRVRG